MWVERTAGEREQWNKIAVREARSHGLVIGGMVWVVLSLMLAGGWVASAQFAVVAESGGSGSFWKRLPIVAIVILPLCWWISRREGKRKLHSAIHRTICPKCETAAEGNAGLSCDCGGSFMPQSTVKWSDEPKPDPAEDSISRLGVDKAKSEEFIRTLAAADIWVLAVGLRGVPVIQDLKDPAAWDVIAEHHIDVSQVGDDDSIHPFNYERDGRQVFPFFSSENFANHFLRNCGVANISLFKPYRLMSGFVATPENDLFELVLNPKSSSERTIEQTERLLLRLLTKPKE